MSVEELRGITVHLRRPVMHAGRTLTRRRPPAPLLALAASFAHCCNDDGERAGLGDELADLIVRAAR